MKFNFTSQICTTTEQSKRLLALGLKKETADMFYPTISEDEHTIRACWEDFWDSRKAIDGYIRRRCIPAWSLHRLIKMMPNRISMGDSGASLVVSNEKVQYYLHDVEYSDYLTGAGRWKSGNTYDNIIDCIEWLIGEGYFNKEYLEE